MEWLKWTAPALSKCEALSSTSVLWGKKKKGREEDSAISPKTGMVNKSTEGHSVSLVTGEMSAKPTMQKCSKDV
jgi:hypothetical protein